MLLVAKWILNLDPQRSPQGFVRKLYVPFIPYAFKSPFYCVFYNVHDILVQYMLIIYKMNMHILSVPADFHPCGLKVTPFRDHRARDKQFSSKRDRGGSHTDFLFEMMNAAEK